MLEQIPNVFKRERRRDVIEKGPDRSISSSRSSAWSSCSTRWRRRSPAHRWLAGDEYTLADVAFTPYLARLEHLDILGMVGERHRVADWYRRCQARPSFRRGASCKWENADYLALMKQRAQRRGRRFRPSCSGVDERAGSPSGKQ